MRGTLRIHGTFLIGLPRDRGLLWQSARSPVLKNGRLNEVRVLRKYAPLTDYLEERRETGVAELTMTFEQIERIIGLPLPRSAYQYRAWWANEKRPTHSHARAWLDCGWITHDVDVSAKAVRFALRQNGGRLDH